MTAIILGILGNVIGAACIGLAGWTWRDGDDIGALGGAIFGACVMIVGHALLLWGGGGMSDWIEHDGTCCPVLVGTWCTARLANGEVKSGTVHPTDHSDFTLWLWSSIPIIWMHKRVIAYRLPRSRAADELIGRIRNLEPEKEPA